MLSITKSLIIIDIVENNGKYLYPVQATHYFWQVTSIRVSSQKGKLDGILSGPLKLKFPKSTNFPFGGGGTLKYWNSKFPNFPTF